MEPHELFPVREVTSNPGERVFVHVGPEDNLGFGLATAYITHSDRHVHHDGTLLYVVVRGALRLRLDDDKHTVVLSEGDSRRIDIGQCHYTVQEWRVEPAVLIFSFPAWTRGNHTKCNKHKD